MKKWLFLLTHYALLGARRILNWYRALVLNDML